MPSERLIAWPRLSRTRRGALVALVGVALVMASGVIRPVRHGRVLAAPVPPPAVLFLGTSLTAGYGLDPSQAYPALILARIEAKGLHYRVVNAGVSGETSAGARRRIDWLLRQKVAVLVVETGANDGLRAQDPAATRENIQAIFDRARQQTPPPKLVLAGMQALPNYGREYAARFRALYPELAQANRAVLIPFLLEGVAGVPRLNQDDGIHPAAEGHRIVAETVWKALAPLLEGPRSSGQGPA
jgi:acyl-CoA thioesterase-1